MVKQNTMKTHFNFAASLLLFAALGQSCKEKVDPTINDNTEVTTVDTSSVRDNDTTMNTASGSDIQSSENNRVASGTSNTSTAASASNRAKGSNKPTTTQGYSAPDGTDAENHDGDQYSKNDQRRMPTGTAIK
jgi:hypothetical protein